MSQNQGRQNIRVAVRCRPLNNAEKQKCSPTCIDCSLEKVTVKDRSTSKVFKFDHVFGPKTNQIDVYKAMVSPIIQEIMMGYNCTIFAYGQTGSGKTYTMTGERCDRLRYSWEADPHTGIIPRALSHIFDTLQENVSPHCLHNINDQNSDFSVRVSFMEVYNEELFDLLSASETNRLTIYDDANRKGSVIVKGLREVVVLDKDNVYSVIERGLARRQTASTLLNAQSSRSHSIFTVTVHIKETCDKTSEDFLRIGKLNLVDLAGSESIGRSGAIEKRAREAGSINQSLLTLGRVITSLVEHAPHIPYRESKLTRLLQDSLGGKTKTSIIATINPCMASLEETLSTLDYAHRAKNIQNRPEINARLNKMDLVRSCNEELERLRRDLEAARTKTGVFMDEDNYRLLNEQVIQQRTRIGELEDRRELLEEDLTQLQENFNIAQSDLQEVIQRKELIENEFVACQKELDRMSQRVIELKMRLDEEEHVCREYQKTESCLREQASTLLSTAHSAVQDVDGWQGKVSRLSQLDQENRSRLKLLPQDWLPDYISSPLHDLRGLTQNIDNFCQNIRNALSELRVTKSNETASLLAQQEELRRQLANCMSDDLVKSAVEAETFADQQCKAAEQCYQEKLTPCFDSFETLHRELCTGVDRFREIILSSSSSFDSIQKQLTGVLGQLTTLSTHVLGAFQSESDYQMESMRLLEQQQAKQDAQIKKMFETLASEQLELQTLLQHRLGSVKPRLQAVQEAVATEIGQLSTSLSKSTKDLAKRNQTFEKSALANLQNLGENMTELSHSHELVKTEVKDCHASGQTNTRQFAESFGGGLRRTSDIWRNLPASETALDEVTKNVPAIRKVASLVGVVHGGVTAQLEDTTRRSLIVENLTGDTRHALTTTITGISDELCQLPTAVEEKLADSVVAYTPTGETPQRQQQDYRIPEKLADQLSRRRLVKRFRQAQQAECLDQASRTPIPKGRGDVSLEEEEGNQEDTLVDGLPQTPAVAGALVFGCYDVADKENRVSTSGLGSQATTINVDFDLDTPHSLSMPNALSPSKKILTTSASPFKLVEQENQLSGGNAKPVNSPDSQLTGRSKRKKKGKAKA